MKMKKMLCFGIGMMLGLLVCDCEWMKKPKQELHKMMKKINIE